VNCVDPGMISTPQQETVMDTVTTLALNTDTTLALNTDTILALDTDATLSLDTDTTLSVDTESTLVVAYDAVANDTCSVLCSGEILHEVQVRQIYPDDKYFVDMKLLGDPDVIISDFLVRKNKTGEISDDELEDFLTNWFDKPGTDIETVHPQDFVSKPRFILDVHDMKFRNWLLELNSKWRRLMRKSPIDVQENQRLYSQIYLPFPFVIPGGRFRELYYWNSYWIVEGLFLCEMKSSAVNMIRNLLHLVEIYGYVPNGSRKYYEGRSEFPMLVPMVDLYLQNTFDLNFIKQNIHLLDREYEHWNKSNLVTVEHEQGNYSMFRYIVNATAPRPEAYSTDYDLAALINNNHSTQLYSDIQAAVVSGWDFSSRWLVTATNSIGNSILDIETSRIIPVDLNCLMAYNAKLLSSFHDQIGNKSQSEYYLNIANNLTQAIETVLWDEEKGFWFDLDLATLELRKAFYGSSMMALWTDSYGIVRNKTYTARRAIDYMKISGVFDYAGGLPASLSSESGLQWDLPNGWAPLNAIGVEGLRRAASYDTRAEGIALDLARKWVFNNYYTFVNDSKHPMMEDYNVVQPGKGSSHFYPVQEGFGWSNAVVMKLLKIYPHAIQTPGKPHAFWNFFPGILLVVALIAVLTVHFVCSGRRRRIREEERRRLLDEEISGYM